MARSVIRVNVKAWEIMRVLAVNGSPMTLKGKIAEPNLENKTVCSKFHA